MAAPAQAWGDKGHEVVAIIARQVIADHDAKTGGNVMQTMDGLLKGKTSPDSFFTAWETKATWGDVIKYRSTADKDRTGPWHYINVDVANAGQTAAKACKVDAKTPAGTWASDGGPQDCVVAKINQFRAELADTGLNAKERELALLYLLHLVGDLHQPLHAGERDDDSGGNFTLLVFKGQSKSTNLHSYYDGAVGGGTAKAIAQTLLSSLPSSAYADWTAGAKGSAETWANESYALSKTYGYDLLTEPKRDCTKPGRKTRKDPNPKPVWTKCFVPADNFVAETRKTADAQLQRAGVRLAYVIIEALKNS